MISLGYPIVQAGWEVWRGCQRCPAPAALRIAVEIDHPAHDCFYLAPAEREKAPLVTADRRLVERVTGTAWAGRVVALDAWGAAG